jgi:hypothetical protein
MTLADPCGMVQYNKLGKHWALGCGYFSLLNALSRCTHIVGQFGKFAAMSHEHLISGNAQHAFLDGSHSQVMGIFVKVTVAFDSAKIRFSTIVQLRKYSDLACVV